MKSSCMELDVLAMYIKGSLSEQETDRFEEHLSECDVCLEEFVIANKHVRDKDLSEWEPVPEEDALSVLEKVNNKIKKFYKWVTALPSELALNPDFALVRSDTLSPTDYVRLGKNMDDLQTDMYVEKTADNKVCIHARVHKENAIAKNVRLTFTGQENSIVSRLLKGDYELFENLSFGSYRLTVAQNAIEKGNHVFEISEQGILF